MFLLIETVGSVYTCLKALLSEEDVLILILSSHLWGNIIGILKHINQKTFRAPSSSLALTSLTIPIAVLLLLSNLT